jgi:hypothetical protein
LRLALGGAPYDRLLSSGRNASYSQALDLALSICKELTTPPADARL